MFRVVSTQQIYYDGIVVTYKGTISLPSLRWSLFFIVLRLEKQNLSLLLITSPDRYNCTIITVPILWFSRNICGNFEHITFEESIFFDRMNGIIFTVFHQYACFQNGLNIQKTFFLSLSLIS